MIIGGTPSRMKLYAEKLSDLFKEEVLDFTSGDRYAFFKVGPVVTVSVSTECNGNTHFGYITIEC